MKICKLFEIIPKIEVKRKLDYGDSELGIDFMGFEQNYFPIAEVVPHDWTIVDLGCYQAAQCYLFRDYRAYIGVDCFEQDANDDYVPPLRFQTKNTTHLIMTIQKFISEQLGNYDLDHTYFIASAVPDFRATQEAFKSVKHCCVVYPGERTKIKGFGSDRIISKLDSYLI